MKITKICLLLNLIFFLAACPSPLDLENPPADRPYYPASLAQTADNKLLIISYNQDQRYNGGSLISLNLKDLTPDKLNPKVFTSGTGLIDSVFFIPSLSMAPTLDSAGNLLLLSRSKSQLLKLDKVGDFWSCNSGATAGNVADCRTGSIFEQLPYGDPYYLVQVEDSTNQTKLLVGYLKDPTSEKIDEIVDSPLKDVGEIQFLTLEKTGDKKTVSKSYFLDDMLPKIEKENESKIFRKITRLGGMKILEGKWVILAATAPVNSNLKKESFLVWFKKDALGKDSLEANSFNITELLQTHSVEAIEAFTDGNIYHVYLTTSRPSRLIKIDMQVNVDNLKPLFQKSVPICDGPIDMKISITNKTLLLACSKNSEIIAFDSQTLELSGKDNLGGKPFGQGPVSILFDNSTSSRAYVAYSVDGSIGVFDVVDEGSNRIKPMGSIFQAAPANHPGGI
ncbi:MAG: hypothetical protein O2897_02745 [bacterium]|nr:hypothetical protein [bacterium]